MLTHTILRFGPGLAAGLLAVACSDQPNVDMAPKKPNFWASPPRRSVPPGSGRAGGASTRRATPI